MSVKAIFAKSTDFINKINKFSGALCSVLIFALAGLTFLNNQLNFDIPSTTKVRDAANFATTLGSLEKLDVRSTSDGALAAVPSTSYVGAYGSWRPVYSGGYGSTSIASNGADFAIYPQATSSNEFIGAGETRVLAYKGGFFFGHSGGPLNWVKSASAGNTVSINGTLYRIVQKTTLPLTTVRNVYYSISEYLSYRGKSYDAIIMTCGDGTYGANGNSSDWRTFLFLERA